MARFFWISTTPGLWSDVSRWGTGGLFPDGTVLPGPADTVYFPRGFDGSCTLTDDIVILQLITSFNGVGPAQWPGTIDFAGKNVTAPQGVLIAGETTILGMEGTTWIADVVEISTIDDEALGIRDLNLPSVWNIEVLYLSHFYYADVKNVHVDTASGFDYGVAAWYSIDSGNNINVRFFPEAESPTFIDGEIDGYAFLEGDIELFNLFLFRIEGEIDGKAFLEGDLDLITHIEAVDGEIDGKAFLEGDIALTMDLRMALDGEIVGKAFLDGGPRATVPVGGGGSWLGNTGGFRCGSSSIGPFDYLNPSRFKLTVGNTIVDFSTPYWTPNDISIDYNGKLLTFTEVATPHFARPSFNNETSVTLDMDLGSGLKTYFRGKIKTRVPHAENNKEHIQYTAFGQQNLAQELDDYGPQGVVDDSFQGPWPVGTVVRRIFENNTFNLSFHGIPATIGVPDETTFSTWTIEELSLRNSQLLSSLNQALKTEPAKRVFFDDLQGDQGKWCFPDLETTNFVDIDIDLTNIDPHDFTVSTQNRWTALRVYVPYQLPIEVEQTGMIPMVAGWDVNYEADWTMRKGVGLDGAQALGDSYRWVFRRWQFDTGNIRTTAGGPVTALILIPFWNETRWVPIAGDLDLDNGVFISKVPIIIRGNPHVAGNAVGPLSAALIYHDTQTQALPAIAFGRIPASGFTGTAYDWFGIAREKQLILEPNIFATQSLEAYTQRKLDVLKDVILAVELPIVGDPIEELINLQAQVIIKNTARGLESVPGFLSKYSYTFGKPGKSVISLSTDRTLVTRVD